MSNSGDTGGTGDRPVVGFIGAGLMGWGMAKNVVEKGYPLRVMAHRKREAVEDLVARGAVEVGSAAEMAGETDVIVLCVTGSPQVEALVAEIAPAAKPGLTIIDTTTSEPGSTRRLAAELETRGITLLDAPLSRTPAHAWEGELTSFVGGPAELVARWRPLIATWASAILPTGGPVGSAHAVKLVNNVIGIGYAAIWSECYATMHRLGLDPALLRDMVNNSGMTCGNFVNFSKYACDGDPEGHKFALENCLKDMRYYAAMADQEGAARPMSACALGLLEQAVGMGLGDRYMPELVDAVRRLNGDSPVVG